jgi:hypothetical protein
LGIIEVGVVCFWPLGPVFTANLLNCVPPAPMEEIGGSEVFVVVVEGMEDE